jgi:hypothetical protein
MINKTNIFLSHWFEMKDLGVVDVILNIKLSRNDIGGITMLQSHYVKNILSRFRYRDCMFFPIPYYPSVLLLKNKMAARDQFRYFQIIDLFIYLASAMRPQIAFAVSKLSRSILNPGDDN